MKINVLTELRQPVGTVSEVDLVEASHRDGELEIRNLSGTAELLRTDRGLLVRFEGTAVTDVTCARCLKQTERGVPVTFEEEYVPYTDPASGSRIRSGFAPDAFRISEDYTLDLREGIRQYVLISESAMPLCRPDCAGLCHECGADLNNGACTHARDVAASQMPQPADIG